MRFARNISRVGRIGRKQIIMAFARWYLYSQKDQLISGAAKAISHPARLRILYQLFNSPPMTVIELIKIHRLSYPAISQHLKILRQYDLVLCEEKCPYTYYRLNEKNFLMALSLLQDYLNLYSRTDS